jgi:hypothetical protein
MTGTSCGDTEKQPTMNHHGEGCLFHGAAHFEADLDGWYVLVARPEDILTLRSEPGGIPLARRFRPLSKTQHPILDVGIDCDDDYKNTHSDEI